jgi:hypothetical protein
MSIDDQNRHPSGYTDDQLRTMLRSERNTVTAKLITAKAHLRALVSQVAELENRLEHIQAPEEHLSTKHE